MQVLHLHLHAVGARVGKYKLKSFAIFSARRTGTSLKEI
jgi:hypothetical protein